MFLRSEGEQVAQTSNTSSGETNNKRRHFQMDAAGGFKFTSVTLLALSVLLAQLITESTAQIACAPPSTLLCPGVSCCGRSGYCGLGQGYCGAGNCLSQCPVGPGTEAQSPPAGLYYYPPPYPYYYYYPPPELDNEEERGHSLVWWLGIIGAVIALAFGGLLVCYVIARCGQSHKHHHECECGGS